jgi:hypothetical protein
VSDARLKNQANAQEVDLMFTNVSTQTVKMDAVELAFETAREKSALFTIAGKFAKKPDNAGLDNDQFEIVALGRTMGNLTIPNPINIPKS